MYNLYKQQLFLNMKTLAQIVILNTNCLHVILRNFNLTISLKSFKFFILLRPTLCISLSADYIEFPKWL